MPSVTQASMPATQLAPPLQIETSAETAKPGHRNQERVSTTSVAGPLGRSHPASQKPAHPKGAQFTDFSFKRERKTWEIGGLELSRGQWGT